MVACEAVYSRIRTGCDRWGDVSGEWTILYNSDHQGFWSCLEVIDDKEHHDPRTGDGNQPGDLPTLNLSRLFNVLRVGSKSLLHMLQIQAGAHRSLRWLISIHLFIHAMHSSIHSLFVD